MTARHSRTPYIRQLSLALDRYLLLEAHPDTLVRSWARAMRRCIEAEVGL